MGAILRAVLILILIVVVIIVVIVAIAYGGSYNVAATHPDSPPVAWFLSTTMDHSVKRHAAKIRVPSLDSPAIYRSGFQQYRRLCQGCHGGPGVKPGGLAQGMYPKPPPMTDVAGDWKPNEFFWIVKNGVRWSGMPAWGLTRTDDQLWAITAFAQRLPKMSEAEYRTLDKQVPPLPAEGAEGSTTPPRAASARSARPSPPTPRR